MLGPGSGRRSVTSCPDPVSSTGSRSSSSSRGRAPSTRTASSTTTRRRTAPSCRRRSTETPDPSARPRGDEHVPERARLTNPYGQAIVATMTYVESLSPAGGAGGVAMETLGPNEQKIIPGAIDYLRGKGVSIGARGAAGYAGALQTHVPERRRQLDVRIRRGPDFGARERRRPVRRLLPGAPDRRERPHRGVGLRPAAERGATARTSPS